MPFLTQNSRLGSAASGLVKSTATVAPAAIAAFGSSSTSMRATTCMPSAFATASRTCWPMRPAAPKTATLIMTGTNARGVVTWCADVVLLDEGGGVLVGADDRYRGGRGEQVGGHRAHVVQRDAGG